VEFLRDSNKNKKSEFSIILLVCILPQITKLKTDFAFISFNVGDVALLIVILIICTIDPGGVKFLCIRVKIIILLVA
jgi:hypothetical protein